MMWSCESSSKSSCLLQFNDGVSALKPAPATACPFAGVRAHALQFVSMRSLHCNARPCVGLLTSHSIFGSVSLKPFPTPLHACLWAGLRVHAALCASVRVHALQCTPMRLLVGPSVVTYSNGWLLKSCVVCLFRCLLPAVGTSQFVTN